MCRRLIDYYHARGGEDSGFMRDVNGKTVGLERRFTSLDATVLYSARRRDLFLRLA